MDCDGETEVRCTRPEEILVESAESSVQLGIPFSGFIDVDLEARDVSLPKGLEFDPIETEKAGSSRVVGRLKHPNESTTRIIDGQR